MLVTTNAIVLKQIPYSDTSLICRLFTKDKGKVTILAKGAWRAKKTIGSLLEPVNHIKIQYYHKNNRGIQILQDACFVQHYFILRNNLIRIILGLAIVEIIDKSTQENNPHPIIYRLSWRVLDKLNNNKQNYWLVFAFFLYQFSLRLGFMPNLTNCCKCNSKMIQGGINDLTGELICSSCITQNKEQLYSFSILNKLTSLHLDDLTTLLLDKKEIIDSIRFINRFLSYHIEELKKIKSMKIIDSIINNNKFL